MFCFSSKKPKGKWRISLTKQNKTKMENGKWKPLSPNCTYLETGENVTDHGPQDRICI